MWVQGSVKQACFWDTSVRIVRRATLLHPLDQDPYPHNAAHLRFSASLADL